MVPDLARLGEGTMLDFLALAQQCAPTVAPQTMAALIQVESRFRPYAIGVVGGRLERQPTTREEAISTAKALADGGWNFSMGIAQVNRYNLSPYNLDYQSVFDPCANLRAGSKILEDCYTRAKRTIASDQAALNAAISCYYSGNFYRGKKADKLGEPSYVQKVLAQADVVPPPIRVVPAVKGSEANPPQYDKAASPATAVTAPAAPATVAPNEVQAPPASVEAIKSLPPPDNTPILVDRKQRPQAQPAQEDAQPDPNTPVQLRPANADESNASHERPFVGQRRERSQTPVF